MLPPNSWRQILALFAEMEVEGQRWLEGEGVSAGARRFRPVLDARYRGQNFEVKVDCQGLGQDDLAQVIERFNEAHALEYGYAIPSRAIEFVSARLQAIGEVDKAPQARIEGGASLAAAAIGERAFYVDAAQGWRMASIYDRNRLPVGQAFEGPAIINEMSATTIVLPGQSAVVDPFGNIIVEVQA